jgi:uncharacterized protein (TIGR02246 family)
MAGTNGWLAEQRQKRARRQRQRFCKRTRAYGRSAGCSALLVAIALAVGNPAGAASEEEIRPVIDRFVAAQNAHDLRAVADTLWDSPQFLWITRGAAIWGREQALARFEALYRGSWTLEPVLSDLRVVSLGDGVAQIYVPIVFTIGAPGQEPQKTRFLMNQVLLKTATGWKVASILPIPAPAP